MNLIFYLKVDMRLERVDIFCIINGNNTFFLKNVYVYYLLYIFEVGEGL